MWCTVTEKTRPRMLLGYAISGRPLYISIIGIFIALTTVLTTVVRIPIPATGGYFNFGDVCVMLCGLLFGPWVGLIAGGVGSMISDAIGFPDFMFITLLAKGLEGFCVGIITNPRARPKRIEKQDIIGTLVGGVPMILIYFFAEVPLFGLGAALAELPWNILQIACAVTFALTVATTIRLQIHENYPMIRNTFYPNLAAIQQERSPAKSNVP